MKKAVHSLLLCTVLCLALSACTGNPPQGATPPPVAPTPSASAALPDAQPTTQPTPEGTEDVFTTFSSALKDAGYTFEEVQMGASLIGAEDGIKYKLDNGGKIELYRFDPESDAYKAALDKGQITMDGIGSFPATVANGMAMLMDSVENEDTVMKIFNDLK